MYEFWRKLGTQFSIAWLLKFPAGGLGPPDEPAEGQSFAQIMDHGCRRVTNKDGGLGLPNSLLYWHWFMCCVYVSAFFPLFFATTDTSLGGGWSYGSMVWISMVQKMFIFWYCWESLGLGVNHGPLHGKFSPPFTDWWYRFTPGVIKYNAPFMSWLPLPTRRTYLDWVVEVPLTYGFAISCLCSQVPSETPFMRALTLCALYEFIFDHGQHLHLYATQNLHVFVCMCFPVEQGQVAGMQLFISWFYACSGWCKIGPWFKYLNISNLLTAKFFVGMPWSHWFRRMVFKNYEKEEYEYTTFARVFSALCAVCETSGPLLCLYPYDWRVVYLGIFFFTAMHIFIIATLIVDVFCWNITDNITYVVLFVCYQTGFDYAGLRSMHPVMALWLLGHALYAIWGNMYPNHVVYVAAHRHAAGNFAMGVLMLKKDAAKKLDKLKAHASLPGILFPLGEEGASTWGGQWLGFYCVWCYFWFWNLPHRMLTTLMVDQIDKNSGDFRKDYHLINSVVFFDALVAHLRFDGLSHVKLVEEVGKVCGFDEGELTLVWAGAFPSYPFALWNRTASWKIIDSNRGLTKEGTYGVELLEDSRYQKPSDCAVANPYLGSYSPPTANKI